MTARLLTIGLLFGILGGIVAALVIPETKTTAAQTATPVTLPPYSATVLRTKPADPTPGGPSRIVLQLTSTPVTGARVPDPLGGPDWVVRVYDAQRLLPRGAQRRGRSRVIGTNRCAQLGRLYRGQFGWVTADGTFRPVRATDNTAAPTHCGARQGEMGRAPFADVVEPMTAPTDPDARIVENVVWGIAGPAATRVRLREPTGPHALAFGRGGAMLAVLPAEVRGRELKLAVDYPGHPAVRALPPRSSSASYLQATGRPRLSAVTPDPEGGLAFGLLVTRGTGGRSCESTGTRVVGDRFGSANYRLDTFSELFFGAGSACGKFPYPGRQSNGRTWPPYTYGTSSGGDAPDEGADPRAGRVARRGLPGRVILGGVALPDVQSLTIATPADVRTITPSGPDHGFIAVYEGDFPTGQVTITTRFKDGRTRTDQQPGLGF